MLFLTVLIFRWYNQKKEGITGWYYGKFIENFDKDYFYSGHLIDFRDIT